jgi:hypothetical protein
VGLYLLLLSLTLGARLCATELTLELAIAGRDKVVFLGLAMKFVISMPFMPVC